MIDEFIVLQKGGIVLYRYEGICPVVGKPIDEFIKSVLLEERGTTDKVFNKGQYALKYRQDNALDLIYIAVYQKALNLSYIDSLLDVVKKSFSDMFGETLKSDPYSSDIAFDEKFRKLLHSEEKKGSQKAAAPKKMKTFSETEKFKKSAAGQRGGDEADKKKKKSRRDENEENEDEDEEEEGEDTSGIDTDTGNESSTPLDIKAKLERMKKSRERKQAGGGSKKASGSGSPSLGGKKEPRKKVGRVWNDQVPSKNDRAGLDFSEQKDSRDTSMVSSEVIGNARDANLKGDVFEMDYESSEDDDVGGEESDSSTGSSSFTSGLYSVFQGLTGNKIIQEDDLTDVMIRTRDHLASKNVAIDIAENLCDSIKNNLIGKKMSTLRGVAGLVKESLEKSLTRLLSPAKRIDILGNIQQCRKEGRPYVITFCGVNGVGKSTNLAKTCFWLLQNDCRVLIAACDTFRAGAVEQLKVHVRSLNDLDRSNPPKVTIFEKGYGKDAAGTAAEAIRSAKEQKVDVVLVDTAGRMQDNEPLMISLAKLVKVNNPDLILFVGEALVGNEAVDQLKGFNKALADHSDSDTPRLVDGMILSKFDTIDDKVGAAISMTYTTGKPIVFVGTGQTYTDLKRLNVKLVVQTLIK
eukprot:Nk52_evm17s267 gene=Nk52_evmTU17s267